jgi:hypothetical protein
LIANLIDDNSERRTLVSLFRRAVTRDSTRITTARNHLLTIAGRLSQLNTEWKVSDKNVWNHLEQILAEIPSPSARIQIWLSIWSELSHLCAGFGKGAPLMLAFDNIDQMASHLQLHLCIVLQQFFADEGHDSGRLKIIFMMRLASASDKIASLPSPVTIHAHEPPSAVDVLATRLWPAPCSDTNS